MRAKRLFFIGLASIAVGIVGLLVLASVGGAFPAAGWGFGPGGMMGMSGMMGGPVSATTSPIGIERASNSARDYIARFGGESLSLGEVMEFGANYYAQAVERDTGIHAFELLVDKYSAIAYPEPGPNMVWNTKYGMMGRRFFGQQGTADMPIGQDRALELARQYLQTQGLKLDVADPARFYGYYTLHTVRGPDGEVEGMLSVNGYSGDIWYHVWHGPFIREQMP